MKNIDTDVKIRFTFTLSKVFAFLLLFLGTTVDYVAETKGTVFMFCVPFCVALISGKQGFDALKEKWNNKNVDPKVI